MESSEELLEKTTSRRVIFEQAQLLVDSIIEKHELKDFNQGPVFTINPVTKVDQHIRHILNVADWLMEKEDG